MKDWLLSALVVAVAIVAIWLVFVVWGWLPFVLATGLFVFGVLVDFVHCVWFTKGE